MTEERFTALWNRCLVEGATTQALPVYEELVRRYSEPHRHYHTPEHIGHCLRQLDLAVGLMDDANAVEMGLWFHDAIYDPRASDNELKSAELFTQRVDQDVPAAFRQSVYDLIMVTMHPEQPTCLDEQFMVDIDLSSFGLPWDTFQRHSEAVRREYAHLSDQRFYPNQIGFLRSLLARPAFFFTDFFRARYEATARENIDRHLQELCAQGYG
jgi:predicted metal-dependent HD superfamily phosphohydrolase